MPKEILGGINAGSGKPPDHPTAPSSGSERLPRDGLIASGGDSAQIRGLVAGCHDYWLVRTLHAWATRVGYEALPRRYPDPSLPESGQSVGQIVFGGGTSLCAAWGITHRWSQDIDFVLDSSGSASPRQLRHACKKAFEETSAQLGTTYRATDDSGNLALISERARDIYDLACIAIERDQFEGHIGRDSKALLHIAEGWIPSSDRKRPTHGFASLASFDASTSEYRALADGYEAVMNEMVWSDPIPLDEAITLAVSLDPGPPEPPPPTNPSPYVAYPRR